MFINHKTLIIAAANKIYQVSETYQVVPRIPLTIVIEVIKHITCRINVSFEVIKNKTCRITVSLNLQLIFLI